jgi:ABC-2 type transport system permease protein
MTAFANHFAFEFRSGIRNRSLLLLNYLFPLGFYLLMGFVMPGLNPMFLDVLVPGMVVFAILSAALLGLPDPLVTARDTGIFRSYKINGVPRASILIIPALTTALHTTIVAALITFSAPFLFGAPLPVNWSGYVLVYLALLFAVCGLGVLIGVVSPNSRVTILLSQAVFLPSMLIGGIMLPFAMLPRAAQAAGLLLPPTHGMNAFAGLAMGWTADFSPWASVAVLLAGGLTAFWMALFLFRWDSQHTTRRPAALALLALVPYAAMVLAMFVF